MNLSEKSLRQIICETIQEYFYGDDEESGDLNITTEDLVRMLPDSEIKNRLIADPDLIDEMLPTMAYDYSLDLVAERHEEKGDYWTPGDSWLERQHIRNDDGLLDNINSVQNEELRNGLLQVYRNLEKDIENGEYDTAFW